ncbi:TIGR00299: TIGR00299 family protein [Rubrobacter radiotolerans]|nr:TIGR00299: TIGR00299 family protein [Rubrobacter radiotolerans]
MTLAALVAAGAPSDSVRDHLGSLGLEFELRFERARISGVEALRASVGYPEQRKHRPYREIRAAIEAADGLPSHAAELALKAFARLAEAEGRVHDEPPESVEFHEVGAVDSIVDVVGSCVAASLLGAESFSCDPLPMGGGTVRAAHGPLPVPGPATLEVLRGSRIAWPDVPAEMTTPTGAALMWAFTDGEFGVEVPQMTLRSVGYGAGRARFRDVPNLLGAVVGEVERDEEGAEGLEEISSNVDDASGEVLAHALAKLLEAGARDAWLEPIYMKKGRAAHKVCALVPAPERERFAGLLMTLTGTLGVRHHPVGRTIARRRIETVSLPYGECRVKVGSLDGRDFVVAPEYEDAVRLARKSGLALISVYNDVRRAFAGSGV